MAKRSTAAAPPITPEVLPSTPDLPDVAMVKTDGSIIVAFLANLVPFFRQAQQLEDECKLTSLSATRLVPPTTAGEDEGLQVFIKNNGTTKKKVLEHWDGICGAFFAVHRRLTGRRGVAVQMLDDANTVAQRLHNTYVAAQRRKADEENERRRQEQERIAHETQEREAAELERLATAAEEGSPTLSPRETVFLSHVLMTGDSQKSARFAGFADPLKAAARLMSMPKIQQALKVAREAMAARQQATAVRSKPVDIGPIDEVRPDISRAPGAVDRTTWTADVLSEARLIEAIISGEYGIPHDVLTVNTVKLNQYARDLQERLNRWPGVRANKNTRTV